MFELDPYNPGMKTFHYVGAGCGVGTIVGYAIQSWSLMNAYDNGGYLVAPILISVIAFTCFLLWQFWFNRKTEKYQQEIREKWNGNETKPTTEELQEIREKITSLSLSNVISEGIFLFMGATSLALYLMFYDDKCDLGCVGPDYLRGESCT